MTRSGRGQGQTPQAAAIALIRTAMIEKKITQASLADAADCHEKTVQNLLAGKSVRQQTLFDVCMVLGLDYELVRSTWSGETPGSVAVTGEPTPRSADPALVTAPHDTGMGGDVAPVYMGAYSRAAVDHYLGGYLTLRSDFTDPETIVAYRTDISWDPSWPSLLFQESQRPDATFSHRGRLYIPPSSMFIHLVSLTKGAMRMIVVSQIDQQGAMRGILTTLHKNRAHFVPVATPVLYLKQSAFDGIQLGDVRVGMPSYDDYRRLLSEATEQGYARLVSMPARRT